MYKEEREQFLEKFRKDQGLDTYNNKSILSNSQISIKSNNTHRPQYNSINNRTNNANNKKEIMMKSLFFKVQNTIK